jgi:hypothetical protein
MHRLTQSGSVGKNHQVIKLMEECWENLELIKCLKSEFTEIKHAKFLLTKLHWTIITQVVYHQQ